MELDAAVKRKGFPEACDWRHRSRLDVRSPRSHQVQARRHARRSARAAWEAKFKALQHQCKGIVRFEYGFNFTDRPVAYDSASTWPSTRGKPRRVRPDPAHQEVVAALREIADWVICDYETSRTKDSNHRHERHRRRHRPRDPRFPRQPHHRSRRGARVRRLRPRGGAVRRVDRIEGSGRAARRRCRALSRQGRHQGRRERQHRDLRGDPRPRRERAELHRPHADRARRHREQGPPRRQRDPRGLVRGGQGRRPRKRRCRCIAISAARARCSFRCR